MGKYDRLQLEGLSPRAGDVTGLQGIIALGVGSPPRRRGRPEQ